MHLEFNKKYAQYTLIAVWVANCLLGSIVAIREAWIPYMNAGTDPYSSIVADPFDGTVMPIAYIPDWSKSTNQNKTTRFQDMPISEYIKLPTYNANEVLSATDGTKASTILRYTYITQYMGSYRLNYRENDGSHLGVDIRVPIGTPVLSIANGVVVRTVEADATGCKFVIIRHENIPGYGTLYSAYLHLSEINVREWTKIRKWDMLGRAGMTGIATTPHLHLQIDTADAPFHPYWPFTSTESRSAGLDFFQSINAALGRDRALKYTVNPMNFINAWASGMNPMTSTSIVPTFNSAPPVSTSSQQLVAVNQPLEALAAAVAPSQNSNISNIVAVNNPVESLVSSSARVAGIVTNRTVCENNRFSDVSQSSPRGKLLYPLVDEKCLFQDLSIFGALTSVTTKEAMMTIMDYYKIEPTNGTSQFLDIPIGDDFQGYALVAYRRWLLTGNYAFPDKILTKWEFVNLLVRLGGLQGNTTSLQIYRDVTPMDINFQAIQAYGSIVRARGTFGSNSIINRGTMVEILGTLYQKTKTQK